MRGRLRYLVFLLAFITCSLLFAHHPAGQSPRTRRASKRVWFAPNLGSPDMVRLFQAPAEWTLARSQIDVFKFYQQQLMEPPPTPAVGPDDYYALRNANAFRLLTGQWHKQIAIEVGSVKPHLCSANGTAEEKAIRDTINAVLMAEIAGGRVSYLAMDEPFFSGVTSAACGGTSGAADRLVHYVTSVKAAFPSVSIGLIEPYPFFRPDAIVQFLDVMIARHIAPPFFHLDADVRQLTPGRDDFARDVAAIASACTARGIRFGMILWGESGESNAAYAQGVFERVQMTRQTFTTWGSLPGDLIFQSWAYSPTLQNAIPTNLPETTPDTHTNLIDRAMALFRSPLPVALP